MTAAAVQDIATDLAPGETLADYRRRTRAPVHGDRKTTGRQLSYIARLTLDLLELPQPRTRGEADTLIKQLETQLNGAGTASAENADAIPF
jgi:hypothetical protein